MVVARRAPSGTVPVNDISEMADLDVKGATSLAGAEIEDRMAVMIKLPTQKAHTPIAVIMQHVMRGPAAVNFNNFQPT